MPNTREKQLELVEVINSYFGVDAAYFDVDAFTLAKRIMESGWTNQKWIPVGKRLPEDEELVLIHCKNGAMFVGYCGKQYVDLERRWRIKTALNSTKLLNLGRVTHWMPLPQPPKGDT
jgi:hypothetical protein